MRNYLLLALAGILMLPAAAQTGRIAQGSHAGQVSQPDDNFGLRTRSQTIWESLVCLNDSMMEVHHRSRSVPYSMSNADLEKAPWHSESYEEQYYTRQQPQSWEWVVDNLRKQYPQAKMVGFDKQLKKRRRPTGRTQTFRKRPFQYSYWRGLATVAALGAVGWLLGRKSKTV